MSEQVEAEEAPTVSLARLYQREYGPMVRLASLLVGSTEAAEELVQDAFVAVHRRWDGLANPGGYLRTCVVNGCRSHQRRAALERRRRPQPRPEANDVGLQADELWDALLHLPYRQRAALVLRYYEDASEAAIAAALDVRPATVRSLVHRGLEKLRKEVPA
ncbi:MAG: sigma-70 family RNA polymerase sigma factor [Actinomycetota bacterium]|nr:sigma-70 family RNA polymerase sigma factor [Actinomycetota bacterium]